MYNYLVEHALKHVWCNPAQDSTVVIELARLSSPGGSFLQENVMWRTIALPDRTSRWYVYQIGGLKPFLADISQTLTSWTSVSDICNANDLTANVYSLAGYEYPRFDAYMLYTPDGDLIVALRRNKKLLFDLNTDAMFLRFYRSAYFDYAAQSGSPLSVRTYTQGLTVSRNDDIIQLQNLIANTYRVLPGYVTCYVNGVIVSNIDLFTAAVGDSCEFVYDGAYKTRVDVQLGDLDYFQSTLDAGFKYLVHYAGVSSTIDYVDDIDVIVSTPKTARGAVVDHGVYFNHNNPANIRNVTHRDYSLSVSSTDSYLASLKAITGNDSLTSADVKITLLIKHSGFEGRALVYEANRIHELYKLSDQGIYDALIGVDKFNPHWSAANLEASAYCTIMRSACCDVTPAMVEQAYGYNGATYALGQTPQAVPSGSRVVTLPYGYVINSTVFEYDSVGRLIGYYYNQSNPDYICRNDSCAFIEVMSGQGGDSLSEAYSSTTLNTPTSFNYEVYYCQIEDGVIDNVWHKAAADTHYAVNGSSITWIDNSIDAHMCVRTDQKFLCYSASETIQGGVLDHTLIQTVTGSNGSPGSEVMKIPMGSLDVFLQDASGNYVSLVPGVDYTLVFPRIVITTKKYFTDSQTVYNLIVRYSDFAGDGLATNQSYEVGFVKYGMVSVNHRYLIKDDKIQRATLNGRVVNKNALVFNEDSVAYGAISAINGQPYSIRDTLVTTMGITPTDTLDLRVAARTVDSDIGAYFDTYYPPAAATTVSVISAKYPLMSVFIARVIDELLAPSSDLNNAIPNTMYADSQIREWLAPYSDLLAFDPVNNTDLNSDNVDIQPHRYQVPVALDIKRYQFLSRAVNLYGNGLVDISQHVTVS